VIQKKNETNEQKNVYGLSTLFILHCANDEYLRNCFSIKFNCYKVDTQNGIFISKILNY